MQSLMKVWVVLFYKAQESHACTSSTSEASYKLFGFKVPKLRLRAHNLFDGLLKGANKLHDR